MTIYDDLERYHLGMVVDKVELAALEEHVLACPECAERAEEGAVYVDTMRADQCGRLGFGALTNLAP